jgi:hypothetical protein
MLASVSNFAAYGDDTTALTFYDTHLKPIPTLTAGEKITLRGDKIAHIDMVFDTKSMREAFGGGKLPPTPNSNPTAAHPESAAAQPSRGWRPLSTPPHLDRIRVALPNWRSISDRRPHIPALSDILQPDNATVRLEVFLPVRVVGDDF